MWGDGMTEVDRRWGAVVAPGDEVLADELITPSRGRRRSAPPVTPAEPELSAAELATARLERTAARALEIGLKRVQMLAWRDFEDPEAGGSELHAHKVAEAWART